MRIKVITYNIDGLPETLDLNDLPIVLRPIAWLYRLFKKTTIVRINDDTNKEDKIKAISRWLASENADIIAVQEDFNFHKELIYHLVGYNSCTHTGGFDIKNLFASVEWRTKFPFPRFKADGLNLITKERRIRVYDETIVPWKKSYGYFNHANDMLTHKGYRQYRIVVDNAFIVVVYVLHMDADFYYQDPNIIDDIEARKAQLKQLTEDIKQEYEAGLKYPCIVMGDFNSTRKFLWDVENVYENFVKVIGDIDGLTICEAGMTDDVDRVFVINSIYAGCKIRTASCKLVDVEGNLSDHRPYVVEFNIDKLNYELVF